MQEITIADIQNKFETLSQEWQWAIVQAQVDEKITKIGKVNHLTAEETAQLSLETYAVLLGFTPTTGFEQSIEVSLNLKEERAKILASEVSQEIIKSVLPHILNNEKNTIDNYLRTENEEALLSGGSAQREVSEKIKSLARKVEEADLVTKEPDPRFTRLPEAIQKIITDSNYPAKIFLLGKENGLVFSQIANLEGIVTDTILGTTSPQMFEARAMSITGLDPAKLRKVVDEINQNILKEIRNQILNLEKKEVKEEALPIESVAPPVEIEAPKKEEEVVAPSIVAQKLTGSFKNTGVVTNHSLPDLKKTEVNNVIREKELPKADPYRMPI